MANAHTPAYRTLRGPARLLAMAALAALLSGCAAAPAGPQGPAAKPAGKAAVGQASYYADKYHGRPTASGERFDNGQLTAAHRTLPFGTKVRVTNLVNGRSVVVRVNDRGPFVTGRIIDLSQAAAKRIDMVRAGVVRVRVEPLGRGGGRAVATAH